MPAPEVTGITYIVAGLMKYRKLNGGGSEQCINLQGY